MILHDLYWLSIKERIVYKLLMLVHKILNNQAPMYLIFLSDLYVPWKNSELLCFLSYGCCLNNDILYPQQTC